MGWMRRQAASEQARSAMDPLLLVPVRLRLAEPIKMAELERPQRRPYQALQLVPGLKRL